MAKAKQAEVDFVVQNPPPVGALGALYRAASAAARAAADAMDAAAAEADRVENAVRLSADEGGLTPTQLHALCSYVVMALAGHDRKVEAARSVANEAARRAYAQRRGYAPPNPADAAADAATDAAATDTAPST